MKYFFLFSIAFISLYLSAQTENANLNTQLESMSSSFLNGDLKVVADYTHPKVLEMMGGKEALIEATTTTFSAMESQGFSFIDIGFKEPSQFLTHNGDLQCAITQVIIMNTPNGNVQSESTILAISEDKGDNWVFLDSSGMGKATLKGVYPNLHPDLEIKPSQKKMLD